MGGLPLPQPRGGRGWLLVGWALCNGVMVVCVVVECPREERIPFSVVMIVPWDIWMLVCFKRRMQQRMGLERPYFKLMQIPTQFLKLFANIVGRDGLSRMLGGTGISLMILNFLLLAIVWFDSMMLLIVVRHDSFGNGSR